MYNERKSVTEDPPGIGQQKTIGHLLIVVLYDGNPALNFDALLFGSRKVLDLISEI